METVAVGGESDKDNELKNVPTTPQSEWTQLEQQLRHLLQDESSNDLLRQEKLVRTVLQTIVTRHSDPFLLLSAFLESLKPSSVQRTNAPLLKALQTTLNQKEEPSNGSQDSKGNKDLKEREKKFLQPTIRDRSATSPPVPSFSSFQEYNTSISFASQSPSSASSPVLPSVTSSLSSASSSPSPSSNALSSARTFSISSSAPSVSTNKFPVQDLVKSNTTMEAGASSKISNSSSSTSTTPSSFIFSKRYLSHLIEDLKRSLTLPQRKYVSGGSLVLWLKSSSEYSATDSLQMGQQLLDAKLLNPVDPTQTTFRNDPFMIFAPEEIPAQLLPDEHLKLIESQGLRAFLKFAPYFVAFNIFLDQSQLGHLLLFWLQAELLKSNPSTYSASFTSELHDKYLEPNSPFCILNHIADNVAAPVKDELELLKKAQNQILGTMEKNLFPRFIRTCLFADLHGKSPIPFTELHIYYLAEKMKDSKVGVPVKEVSFHTSVFPCFVGKDAVDWMTKNVLLDQRSQAIEIIQYIMEYQQGTFFQLDPELRFKDEIIYYSFTDKRKRRKRRSIVSDGKRRNFSRKNNIEPKQQIIKNFEQYQAEPLKIETVVDKLTLGATFHGRTRANTIASAPTSPYVRPELDRSSNESPDTFHGEGTLERKERIERRQKMKIAADIFNESVSKGLKYIVEVKLVRENSPTEIARFLHKNSLLSKKKIGELLGENDELSKQIMHAFIGQLDFTDLDFDIALRHLLYGFRLPGESQKIDRILQQFAVEYFHQNPNTAFANSDAAWALAFAAIMLNTDAHSQQVKKKMTKEQFIHNCRGINDGEDFPRDFLSDIYDRIVLDEIRMLEDGALYPNALKKGWAILKITKGGKTKQKWKRFWFVLDQSVLHSFKKPGEVFPLSTIELKAAELLPTPPTKEDKKFCFQLLLKSTVPKRKVSINNNSNSNNNNNSNLLDEAEQGFVFSLPSERELNSWMKVLDKTIQRAKTAAAKNTLRRSSF